LIKILFAAVFTELFLNASIEQLTFANSIKTQSHKPTKTPSATANNQDATTSCVSSLNLHWSRIDARFSEFRRRSNYGNAGGDCSEPSTSQSFHGIARDTARLLELIIDRSQCSLRLQQDDESFPSSSLQNSDAPIGRIWFYSPILA